LETILVWLVALLLGGGLLAFFYSLTRKSGQSTADPGKRERTYNSLLKESPSLASFDTADFLLAAARDLYDIKHAAIATLDDKAQKLMSFLGGGATLVALLNVTSVTLRSAVTPFLFLSALCFLLCFIFLIFCLNPATTEILQITEFNSIPVLSNPDFRPKIAYRLIDGWQTVTLGLTPVIRRKGLLLFAATMALIAGFMLFAGNVFLAYSSPTKGVQHPAVEPTPIKNTSTTPMPSRSGYIP
jgi:hypothetical protein